MLGINLEPTSIIFPSTYISAISRFAVKIENTANVIKKISFRTKGNIKEEQNVKIDLDSLDVNHRNQLIQSPLFKNDAFTIEPAEFDLFPKSFNLVIVEFCPSVAIKYNTVAYVQIDDLSNRLKFEMTGIGLPPVAYFATDTIVIGHINLDSVIDYEVELINSGQVNVDFNLDKKQTLCQFTFSPSSGAVPIGGSIKINIRFIASSVGNFMETFTFRVRGATQAHPQLSLSGKVIGPSFSIMPRRIDFGGVGYGFLHTEKLEIENKSDIPFDFKLRMSHDGTFERREFQIFPETGTIPKYGKTEVIVEFIPISTRNYNLGIVFDIDKYGEKLAEIPITASCLCPSLALSPEVLDFGDVFIGYQYTNYVILKNTTEYAAKFEFIKQNPASMKLGLVEVIKDTGIVSSHDESKVGIMFTGIHIGHLNINCFFSVYGSDEPPIKLIIVANCIGPNLELSSNNILFGNVSVLTKQEKKINITNNSLISASFRTFFEPQVRVFDVEPKDGIIQPKESITLSVCATLTDVLAFATNLKLQFEYLNTIVIPIKANGVGSPILSSINMENIDIGYVLTESPATMTFTLTNKSDRTYEIRWSNQKPRFPKDQCELLYTMEPDYAPIRPHCTQSFLITLICRKVTSFTMNLTCNSTVGRTRSEVFQPVLKGTFIQPLIGLSTNLIEFREDCVPKSDTREDVNPPEELLLQINRQISVTNKSKISLNISIDCPEPFSFSKKNLEILPSETIELDLYFDTSFKTDFVSETIIKKMLFMFEDHPQKVTVTLKGIINFPNVSFSSKDPIDFGVAMVNTEQTKTIEMKNVFDSVIHYDWEFMSNDELATKAFDIFPLRGDLDPGATIETHFGYFALADPNGKLANYIGTAVCHIFGGPDYQFPLKGSSASINYRIEPLNFEFGEKNYSEEITEKLTIINTSKVPLKYSIQIPRRTKFKIFNVHPSSGTVSAKEEQEVEVHIIPGLPRIYHESLTIHIGGFEDIQIHISISTQFAQISMPLPRAETDVALINIIAENKNQELKNKIQKEKTKNPEEEDDLDLSDQEIENEIPLERFLNEEKSILTEHIKSRSKSQSIFQTPQSQPFYVAQYVFDYGEMILGEIRKETIPVTNNANFPISFDVNIDKLKRTGFKIEPISYKDIQGHSNANLDIIFNPTIRRNNELGPVCYEVPFTFSDDHQILFIIKASLKLPELTFSNLHFNFYSVVIGQTKIMTLQLQNMNNVGCEFKFGAAEYVNILHKNNGPPPEVFSVVPDTGVLPPSSYMNIAIHFSPIVDKPFQMQFPITLKHALTPSYITVEGKGVLLQLTFDPTELRLPSVQPFSSPSFSEVTVNNPTDYAIEFYSLQFDRQLYNEIHNDPRQTESPFVTFTPKAKTPITANKFAVCIIVSGSPFSGKSTVAKQLSQQYGLPIIDLEQVWKETSDYVSALYSQLCQSEYRSGVIIDGVSLSDDATTKENDVFMNQCLKMKNLNDELVNKIPPVVPHQQLSSVEKALDNILAALDGHYVFHISLKTTFEVASKRKELRIRRERGLKRHQLREEKNRLFNMTEEEYEKLTHDEKEKIDEKRRSFRDKLVDKPEDTKENDKHRRGKSHSKRNESGKLNDPPTTAKSNETKETAPMKRRTAKTSIPQDPIEQAIFLYSLCLGSLIQKLQSPTDRFKSLDPLEIIKFDTETINHSGNTVIINSEIPIDEVMKTIMSFVPPLTALKESAFKLLIPESVTQDIASSNSLMKKPQFFSIVCDDPTSKLTPKWKLQPKTQTTLRIQFDPFMPGILSDELFFAVSQSNSPPIGLKVKGDCFFPQIERNPKILFPLNIKKFDQKQTPAFITETNEYNFGYLLICKEKVGKSPMFYHSSVIIANITVFPCEITATFIEPASKAFWGVDQPSFVVQPNGKTELSIGFHPTSANLYKATLVLSIKDNPEPLFINLVGESFSPSIDISTLSIDFDKILINTEKTKKIELKNPGKLAAFWRLKGANAFSGILTFNQMEGVIQPKGSSVITLKFQASKSQQVKKTVNFEVMDEGKQRIFHNDTIQINAEAFDVNFDVNVPKTGSEQLDFGQMKVGQTKMLQIGVKNRGKYPVQFKFTITDKNIAKYLTMTPTDGVAPVGDKGTQINITFKAINVVSFQTQKAISLKVVDTQTNTVTAQQTFTFCAKAFYNTFSASCGKKVDFGICQIGAMQKKEFTITNNGVFPFELELLPKNNNQEDGKLTSKTVNKGKAPPPKTKAKPRQANALVFGAFSIIPNSTLLQPNSSQTFTLEFMSNDTGNFKESLCIVIPDINPTDSNYTIHCHAHSFQPSLELKDNENIFPKLPLIIRSDLHKSDITSFLEDERILHFTPRIQGQQESVTICLINPQPIECVAEIVIKSKGKASAFDVKDKTVTISAKSSASTTIIFTPPGCDNYQAIFEATAKTQANSPPLKFGLEGIGAFPSITLKTPLDKSKNGFILNLGKTLLGYSKQKTVAISNDTPLKATVSVSTKATPDFELSGIETTKPFSLDAGRQFQFKVTHKPQKSRKSQFDVSFAVLDNPKSTISIGCVGEGFSEDLIFEGLEGEDSELHFRDAIVGRSQAVSFTMKNVSDSAIRFTWNASGDVSFAPRIGHIRRNQSKEITAVFYSEKPTKFNGTKGCCQISKIELINSNSDDWDDSMKVVSFVPRSEVIAQSPRRSTKDVVSNSINNNNINNINNINNNNMNDNNINNNSNNKNIHVNNEGKLMKVTTVVAEPPYHPISAGKPRELPIKIFVISDNIKCSIDITDIAFAPTMMFQTRTSEVKVTNTCQIRMEYQWTVESFVSLRSDYSATRPPAFSIEPSTGFIEAGQSTIFRVNFSPMEVDDFICTMKCDVPYMNLCDPPKINLNGLSRRPLCHFNVATSDYLMRRHPDFNYILPDGIKVIELFSKGVRIKSVKKLEIINPTSAPYDSNWTMINDNSNGSISVENNPALVSSGKHYFFQFVFTPNSAKLVESLWEFNIPEHGVKIPFLFVGRITH